MTTLRITHPSFLDHVTGPHHPERPDRMRAIDKALAHDIFSGLISREAPLRSDDEEFISKTHGASHFQSVRDVAERLSNGLSHIDGDTVVSPGTWQAARRAVGAGLDAVDLVISNTANNVFCQVRPPGHHAESHRAMGFCFFNNIAVAANYVRLKYGAERVAVIDFDVHHGNGTQQIFWSDKNCFYGSTHQMPLFPGTGALNETGTGNIFNAPLTEGDGRDQFESAFRQRILAPLHNFAPDFVFISAGFDGHVDDPLGGLRLAEPDFAWATEQLAEAARRHANGRIVSMLEGGYNLTALARSVAVHVKTLMETGS